MHEGRISDRKMGRTGLFSQFFPFFIELFEFFLVCCFFFCQFLAFHRIGIDSLPGSSVHRSLRITRFQFADAFLRLSSGRSARFTEPVPVLLSAPASLVWIRTVNLRRCRYFGRSCSAYSRRSVVLFSPGSNRSCRYNSQTVIAGQVPEFGWLSG